MERTARQSRQVACHFCRVRKLKCSRNFPCSNCTARGVSCPSAQAPASAEPPTPGPGSTEILRRLERVEALLAARADVSQATHAISVPSPAATATSSSSNQPCLPPKLQNLVDDAVSIHRSGSQTIPYNAGSDNIIIRTCPIPLFTQLSLGDFYNPSNLSAGKPTDGPTYIWLPTQPEAEALIEKYFDEVGYAHSILHGPCTRRLFRDLYDSLQIGSQPPTGALALLLAVFAAVGHFWTPCQQTTTILFSHYKEANAQGASWREAAFSLLEKSQQKPKLSLEHVLALIILTNVNLNIEGITSRTYSTFCRAVTASRELGLHILDQHRAEPPTASEAASALTGVRAEIGRRAWWHLVATDWMLSCCSGPQKGTYSINPHHMAVRRPSNVNDEDIADEGFLGRPIDQPTSMSFFLQRLYLAEHMRAYTDRVPLVGFDPYSVGYDIVLELDGSIERYIQQIPPFLYQNDAVLDGLSIGNPKTMILQRYLLAFMIHSQRCRLHLPYFARGTIDPTYAYSQKVALQSARLLISAEYKLRQENYDFASARFSLGAVMYGYFVSVVILVLDLCQTTNEHEHAIKRREVGPAWRILEEAQTVSRIVLEGIETLSRVMEKYNLSFWSEQQGSQEPEVEAQAHNMPNAHGNPAEGMNSSANPRFFGSQDLSQQTGGLDLSKELEGVDWDRLLWVADAPFL